MSAARVLVIEDEAGIREVIRTTLEALGGHRVTLASDGEAGLEAARREPPDLILLDVLMPGLSGIEVMRMLRLDAALRHVPVVFLTARTQGHEVSQYQELGAADVLAKPFDPMELASRVERVLAQSRSAPATGPAAGHKVLVVEDDAGVRYLVEFVLTEAGLHYECARDAREALRRFEGPAPDLVIMDFSLPDGTGPDLVRALRKRAGWDAVPVLMLTGRAGEAQMRDAFDAGAADYLMKPFELGELEARVRKLLARG